jgi:hypothetical protein
VSDLVLRLYRKCERKRFRALNGIAGCSAIVECEVLKHPRQVGKQWQAHVRCPRCGREWMCRVDFCADYFEAEQAWPAQFKGARP